MKSLQQSRIPLRMAVLNLVHELMHAFGAQHDPEEAERAECTPTNAAEDGRFLMSKYSNNGRKHNHELVSPCTQQSVSAVLQSQTRTRCLVRSSSAFCGDGLVQPGEEQCDCGTDWACLLSRACCHPPSNTQPGGCTLRSQHATGRQAPANFTCYGVCPPHQPHQPTHQHTLFC